VIAEIKMYREATAHIPFFGISKYSFPVYLEEITMKEWGVRDFVFKDPSGVMWRVAEIKKENTI